MRKGPFSPPQTPPLSSSPQPCAEEDSQTFLRHSDFCSTKIKMPSWGRKDLSTCIGAEPFLIFFSSVYHNESDAFYLIFLLF